MQDYIVRAMTKDGFVKAVAISSAHLVERARIIHHTTPTATAALAKTGAISLFPPEHPPKPPGC